MSGRYSTSVDQRGPAALWDTRSDYPRHLTIHALFEEQARERPHATAVTFGSHCLTYRELNDRADRMAQALREHGVCREALVGVSVERSLDLIVALLGILKAGGAYLPFDANYPSERIEFMLADSGTRLVIAGDGPAGDVFRNKPGVTVLPPGQIQRESSNTQPSLGKSGPRDLAYVMYTSGSTGKPKGVQVEHRSVVRLVKQTNYCHFGSEEVFLQFAPTSFDASTLEIWGALLNGGRLVIMPPQTPSLGDLGRVIREHGVTTIWLTAGLFHVMVDQRLDDLRSLKQLLAGGDVLSAAHIRKVLAAAPACTVINGYGPTEGTTFTCCHVMRSGDSVPDSVPIGRPIANTQVYILGEELQPVAAGESGELYIGGDGVARGYLNRPELTAEKFIPDPFSQEKDGRLYRSGDLARCRPDGTVEFLGRLDNQVKINGFRIELGEIETVLQQHSGVRQAVVAARSESGGEKRLVAYVVTGQGQSGTKDLREYAQRKLPQYMIPGAFVMMESLPLSPNGKVDRRALPAPESRTGNESKTNSGLQGLEQVVAGIWRTILGNPAVGLDDNFFDLGGDSLMLMEAHAQLQKTVPSFDLSIVDLFELATIRSLVKRLEKESPVGDALTKAQELAKKQRAALASQRQRRGAQYKS